MKSNFASTSQKIVALNIGEKQISESTAVSLTRRAFQIGCLLPALSFFYFIKNLYFILVDLKEKM